MTKAEAGICCMFVMRHLTLLNTSKYPKFQKSFCFALRLPSIATGSDPDHPLRDQSLSDT
jgi:hypothetical protein